MDGPWTIGRLVGRSVPPAAPRGFLAPKRQPCQFSVPRGADVARRPARCLSKQITNTYLSNLSNKPHPLASAFFPFPSYLFPVPYAAAVRTHVDTSSDDLYWSIIFGATYCLTLHALGLVSLRDRGRLDRLDVHPMAQPLTLPDDASKMCSLGQQSIYTRLTHDVPKLRITYRQCICIMH